ncbi:MAG: MT-A70 family methyltransferase, partial [Candidatus Thermoplasmatota archaeon]|nr:MT-A70 family methyltransferase [Candidatus Thermoplasmatota archaeon]
MKREEEGLPSPDPDLHGNHEDQVFKVYHPKPICPRCGKKSVIFYIRGNNREYISQGFYCKRCQEPVKTMSAVPPRVFKMGIEEFLRTTSERYDVILADPAWTYDVEAVRPEDRISSHYHQMSTQEICDLPVINIANKNAYLFLWVTSPKLDDGMMVLQSWGFQYLTSIAWDKELMGLGHVVRTQHELILIGRRGHPTPPALKFRSVIREKR